MEDHPPYDAWAPPPTEPPTPPPPAVIPWEDPSRPWLGAFVATIGAFLSRPRRAFESVPVHGDVLRPLIFALLVGWIGQFFYAVYEISFGDAMRTMLPADSMAGAQPMPRGAWFVVMALAPLLTGVYLVIVACVAHLFLLLLGAARSGFVATFRVLCYVQVASLAFMIPFCGGAIGGILELVLAIVGFSVLHRISLARSAAAVLLPTLLCCACLGVLILLVGAAALSALGGLAP